MSDADDVTRAIERAPTWRAPWDPRDEPRDGGSPVPMPRGGPIERRVLGGGSIARVERVLFEDGGSVVAKHGVTSVMLREEAIGLDALRRASGPRVPHVLHAPHEDGAPPVLLLEWIEPGRARDETWPGFGRALAAMHAERPGTTFGFEVDNHLGRTPQSNPRSDSWCAFVRHARLEPMAERLDARGGPGPRGLAARLRTISERVDALLPSRIVPSLIHGDLWSGNALIDREGRVVLIDPAPARCDAAFEIGMMQLFGGIPNAAIDAWHAAMVERGWSDERLERRVALARLHHLANHVVLFGEGYLDAAMREADGVLAGA